MATLRYVRHVGLVGTLAVLFMFQSVPTASAHHGGGHYLQLISIYCNTTEDWTGADEPYLRVSGKRVWGGSLNDKEGRNLEGLPVYWFTSQVTVTLYDADAGLWDDDDFLGRATIYATDADMGDRTVYFTEDDAEYELTYRVGY